MHHPILRDSGFVAGRSVLRIGGIAFVTTSALPLHLAQNPAYSDFLACDPAESDLPIEVSINQGEAAPPPDARLTFDTGSAWSAYALPDGDRSIVMALPAARDKPLLSARFDPEVTRVRVTCSSELLVEGRFFDPLRYPLDQLLMMQRLACEGGSIIHCALIAVGDRAVICPGVSGAGKTTLTRQLEGNPRFRILSDDRAVIRRARDGYMAYGTPWPGEGGFAVNEGLPLVSIGFIQQREGPSCSPISPSEAIHRLVRMASLPLFDRQAGPRVFDGLADLCGRVPVWRLGVPPDPSAATAVNGLAEGRAVSPV
ncbi:MAG: hypothetical protein JJE39_09585 [Vicinamibacteria bacterium]|nr:hypothetical protein [Vicinamibacteria bacterium]